MTGETPVPLCSKTLIVPEEVSASDEELVRQSQAGCLVSFEGLVHRHEARIYRFVRQRCGCVEDARDVTQTVFVTAFQKLDQFHQGHSFSAWLFAIARNRATDWLRRRRIVEPVVEDRLVDETSPAEAAGAADDAAALWRLAREVLSPGHFDAVWLHYQEGLSLAEVAQATRQSVVGVKVRLFRARQKLGEALQRRGWIAAAPGSGAQEPPRGTLRNVSATVA